MDRDFLEFVVWTFLRQYALAAEAKEVIAFRVGRSERGALTLDLLVHFRPDDTDEQTRDTAIHTFEAIMRTCLDAGMPGAQWIGNVRDENQYCLTVPFPGTGEARFAFGLIVGAADQRAARAKLESLLRR
jgi:hypothetical protein